MQIMFIFVDSTNSVIIPPERSYRTGRVLVVIVLLSAALVIAGLCVHEARLRVQSLVRPVAAFSTQDKIDASAVSCSLTRPRDGKHLWVATDGSVAAASVCAHLIAIGWR
jgi:hypothetical protein